MQPARDLFSYRKYWAHRFGSTADAPGRPIAHETKDLTMPSPPSSLALELNDEGFLVHPEAWDRGVALALAHDQEGLSALNEKHWAAVVDYIRTYWLEHGMAPMVRALCQHTGLRLREIYELFPSGPAKGACKVAGLPKPDGCV